MNHDHHHGKDCAPGCRRQYDVDPTSTTESYRIAVSRVGLRRKVERPRWWPFALIAFRQLTNLLGLITVAAIAKACGLKIGLP